MPDEQLSANEIIPEIPSAEEQVNQNAESELMRLQSEAMDNGQVNAGMYAGGMKQEPALIQWQLDCKEILDDIERRLKRYTYNPQIDAYSRDPKITPLIPDRAVDMILYSISPVANQNTLLSLMKDKTIVEIINELIDNIDYYLSENMIDFELKNRTDINMIINPIHTMLYALFNRSINFKTLNTLSKNYNVTENTSSLGVTNPNKNNGLFSSLPFVGGGGSNRN